MLNKFEKPTPAHQETTSEKNISEKIKIQAETKPQNKFVNCLNTKNKEFFVKMSEVGKNIVNKACEGFKKNTIIKKFEIVHNQFWADKHQEKILKLKNKIDSFDSRIDALSEAKKEVIISIEDLKKQKIPGADSLMLKIQDIEQQKIDLLNKKDKIQTKLEGRENKMNLYINERDRIVNKFIEKYNEKLKPLEKNLENLHTEKNRINLFTAVSEAKHKEQLIRLDEIKTRREKIIQTLINVGMSERKIMKNEAIKELDKMIKKIPIKIQKEEENLINEKIKINKQIANIDAKAEPHRNKRQKFARIKQKRPLKIELEERKYNEKIFPEEPIKAHSREKNVEEANVKERVYKRINGGKELPEIGWSSFEDKNIIEKKADQRIKINTFITNWNLYLKEKFNKDKDIIKKTINLKEFIQTTKLNEKSTLDSENFKKILNQYYKFKKIRVVNFEKNINNFLEQKNK